MIKLENIKIEENDIILDNLNLQVENGEIYFLICKDDHYNSYIFDMLQGFIEIEEGKIFLDSNDETDIKERSILSVNRFENLRGFDREVTLKDFVDFTCSMGKEKKDEVLKILFKFDLFEKDLKKKIKLVDPFDFKAVYLALSVANDHKNIVIHDFINEGEKEFELRFNRLLKEIKKEGKAILYLTGNIFYSYRIADRVSFLKDGFLMPSDPIESEDLQEMDMMTLYKKFLS